jgi:hypothetical protein
VHQSLNTYFLALGRWAFKCRWERKTKSYQLHTSHIPASFIPYPAVELEVVEKKTLYRQQKSVLNKYPVFPEDRRWDKWEKRFPYRGIL